MTSPSNPFAPNTPMNRAVDALASARIDELEALAEAARDNPTPERVHAMRVAARQLRALLRLVRPECDADAYRTARAALTGFVRVLGGVRDRDVLLEGVAELRESLPSDPQAGFDAFAAHLERDREAAFDEQRRYLVGEGRRQAIETVRELFAIREPNTRTVAKWGRSALRKSLRRVTDARAALDPNPSDDALHRLRKEVRRLRYLADFLKPVLRKPGRRLRRRARNMQDILGRHQDVVVLKRELRTWAASAVLPNPDDFGAPLEAVLDERRRLLRDEFDAEWKRNWKGYAKKRKRRFVRGVK